MTVWNAAPAQRIAQSKPSPSKAVSDAQRLLSKDSFTIRNLPVTVPVIQNPAAKRTQGIKEKELPALQRE